MREDFKKLLSTFSQELGKEGRGEMEKRQRRHLVLWHISHLPARSVEILAEVVIFDVGVVQGCDGIDGAPVARLMWQ